MDNYEDFLVNCKHTATIKMPGLENKRECLICHKFIDVQHGRISWRQKNNVGTPFSKKTKKL